MSFKVLAAQINTTVGDFAGNSEKILKAYQHGQKEGVDVVITPELSLTGYTPQDLCLRNDFGEAQAQAAQKLAAQTDENTLLLFGFLAAARPQNGIHRPYNAVALAHSGKLVGVATKSALAEEGEFVEKRLFSPGKPGVFEWKEHKIGIAICRDLWEKNMAIPQALKTRGAEMILSLNASPYHETKRIKRRGLLKQLADGTGLPFLYVNQVGGHDELVYDGDTMIVNPDEDAPTDVAAPWEESYLISHFENNRLEPVTGTTEKTLSEEAHLYQALLTATKDFVTKCGFGEKGVVLGLSGGIDSALVAALATDALGPEHVQAYMLPSAFTTDASEKNAATLAKSMSFSLKNLPIDMAVNTLEKILHPATGSLTETVTHQNIQARTRGLLLMGVANATGAMLLSTGNKSELFTGYATLYGDMCGGFNPLKDVYKTQVYKLAKWRNGEEAKKLGLKGTIPENILERAPSAELAPDQKDEDTLPPYIQLDAILKGYIEKGKSAHQLVKEGHAAAHVQQVIDLIKRSEFKRFQACPGPKVSSVSPGRDRMVPLAKKA